jgi:Flp pilus assembly protein TadG
VEFTIVAPLLLVILFAMLDLGKAFNYWIDATQLASTGARYAVVNNNPGTGGATLQQYIQSQAVTSELRTADSTSLNVTQPAQVCITFPSGSSTAGQPVKVEVKVNYTWLPFLRTNLPIIGRIFGSNSTTLTGSSTMRLEAAPSNYSSGAGSTGTAAC